MTVNSSKTNYASFANGTSMLPKSKVDCQPAEIPSKSSDVILMISSHGMGEGPIHVKSTRVTFRILTKLGVLVGLITHTNF